MIKYLKSIFERHATYNVTNNYTNKTSDGGRYEFELIGSVLIIHVPVGRMPPAKAEEHVKRMAEIFIGLKSELGVEKLILLAKHLE